ncbi:MAG: metal-sensing transcriptional repressor [Eubacteriaceae bacterium]|nr:metal-sensing transcriptional repressor [Eubacteriaceae bacterium]MBR2780136.1 metal-sensing transcriptional repressor [Eubacteriaceae bacterium]MCR4893154.1 metal-sensing transcriptional repressor [Eubacteriales bacterium]
MENELLRDSGINEDVTDAGGCPCCSGRHTDRSDEDKKALITRLRRIEGQIRGLEGMVEKDAYCPDILVQVSAATSALNSFSRQLLSRHIQGCVRDDILSGDDSTIDELCQLLQKLMK